MLFPSRPRLAHMLARLALLCGVALVAAEASGQATAGFHAAALHKPGDSVSYGSYKVIQIGPTVYQINDPGVTTGKGGAWGADMYLICGPQKALLVDLGNDYIDGYAQDVIAPRPNAAEELRAVVYGLAGKRTLEIAITHAHPDHDGMTGAFLQRKVTIWMPEGEDFTAPKTQHGLDPAVYTAFKPGSKTFDLGDGHIVSTYLVRGHTAGGSVYLSQKDMMLFTGDSLGSGFGQAFATVDRLRLVAEDSAALVKAITASYTPVERYALKVYTGHAYQNTYGGFKSANMEHVDVGYLDWRFVQNVASCANGILAGKWLVPESGLTYVGNMAYTDMWPTASGRAIMVYGIGTILVPIDVAYQAAGLKAPEPTK